MIAVIEGLLWNVQGEGEVMDEGPLRSHADHTAVMALRNEICSSWKGRCDWIDMNLEGGEF